MNLRLLFKPLGIFLMLVVAANTLWLPTAAAATLTLQSIGASTVGGQRISSWTYTGTNPLLSGTADPSATVTITIDGVPATATADASGNWSYKPTTLATEGSYTVSIVSGDQTLAFTLAIGAYTGSTTTGTTATASATTKGGVMEELPVSGSVGETLQLIGIGLGLIGMGFTTRWLIQSSR